MYSRRVFIIVSLRNLNSDQMQISVVARERYMVNRLPVRPQLKLLLKNYTLTLLSERFDRVLYWVDGEIYCRDCSI